MKRLRQWWDQGSDFDHGVLLGGGAVVAALIVLFAINRILA